MRKFLHKISIFSLIALFFFQASGITPALAHDFILPGGSTPNSPPDSSAPGGGPPDPPAQGQSGNNSDVGKDTEPIHIDAGDFFLTRQDLSLPGRGLSVDLAFIYRSRSSYNGPYGYGWDMTYNRRLKKLVGGNAVLLSGDNRKDEFAFGAGNYASPAGIYATLIENQDGTFTLSSRNGRREFFDVNGNLTRLEDKNGNAVTFTYDPAGLLPIQGKSDYFVNQVEGVIAREYRLTQITDTVGRTVNFAYNTDGRIESIAYAGRTTTYGYDPSGSGDLISVTTPPTVEYPQGLTTQYGYLNHNLTTATDPKGQTYLTNVYDAATDRATSQTYGGGTTTLSYDQDVQSNPTTTVTDRKGFVTLWTFNATGNPIRQEAFTQGLRPTDPTSYVTAWIYNANMEKTEETLPRGNKIAYTYDESNPDPRAKGNLLEIRRKPIPGSPDPDVVTAFTYEPNYQFVKTMTDPRGNVTTYTYDYELGEANKGNLRKITYPSVDGQTIETTLTYNSFGQPETVTDPNGNATRFTYVPATGYIESITNADATSDAAITYFDHDVFGNVIAFADANGHATTFQYNELNQLIKSFVPNPFNFVTDYAYDENANLKTVTRHLGNQPITTNYTYTVLDQLQTITDPLNHTTTFGYDNNGNRTSILDAESKTTTYDYDERDLLWKVTDANLEVTEHAYDENGNLKEIKDANSNPTTYVYDDFDRLKTTTYADLSEELYTYDAASNLKTKQDPMLQTILYDYDALNRLTLKTYPNATAVDYIYDVGSRLTSVQDPVSNIVYQYDPLNRVKQANTTAFRNPSTVAYTYDGVGNRKSLTYPDGSGITYFYDALNRLTAQNTPIGQFTFSYDSLSRRIGRAYPNQTQTEYGYDEASRLTALSNTRSTGGGGGGGSGKPKKPPGNIGDPNPFQHISGLFRLKEAWADFVPISNFSYTYDFVGNRLSKVFNGGQQGESYGYDALYQLTSVSNFQSHSYTYDPLGNRLTVNGTPYTVNSLNQYSSVNGTTYTYNANGNLTSDGAYTYGYDYENRLISVTGGGVNATYTYDPFGRRIEKQVNGVITRYLYDGDQILEERDNTNTLKAKYTHGPGIDELLAMNRNNKTYFYYQDGLGSTTEVVESGIAKESYSYDPYGKVTIKDLYGTVLPQSAIGNPYLFTGRELDSETGNYYYRARHYHPGIGRFLQRDLLEYLIDLNSYRYVNNNPVVLIDPSGLRTILVHGVDPAFKGQKPGWTTKRNENGKPKSGPSDLRASLEARGEAVVEFTWSGLVSDHKAAQASLAAKLKEERAKADANHEKLNIIGHSWGSVLGYGAVSTSDTKVDNLITIGSPLRSGLEKPKNVEHWDNYWSVTDPVSWPSSGVISDTNEPIVGGHSAYWDDPYVRAGINLAISSNPSGQNGKK